MLNPVLSEIAEMDYNTSQPFQTIYFQMEGTVP